MSSGDLVSSLEDRWQTMGQGETRLTLLSLVRLPLAVGTSRERVIIRKWKPKTAEVRCQRGTKVSDVHAQCLSCIGIGEYLPACRCGGLWSIWLLMINSLSSSSSMMPSICVSVNLLLPGAGDCARMAATSPDGEPSMSCAGRVCLCCGLLLAGVIFWSWLPSICGAVCISSSPDSCGSTTILKEVPRRQGYTGLKSDLLVGYALLISTTASINAFAVSPCFKRQVSAEPCSKCFQCRSEGPLLSFCWCIETLCHSQFGFKAPKWLKFSCYTFW